MVSTTPRKHAVALADYPFERDLQIRLFLAATSPFEISVIEEIVNGSVKISIKNLLNNLDADEKTLLPLLKKLEIFDLHKIQDDTLLINKEMRKYFAYELEKFSHSFEPDLQHLQALLTKVPIHILPQWYSISRTSDNIFNSIVEKYFITPKAFRKHVDELNTENPRLYKVFKCIMESDDFCIDAQEIMKKFQLDHKQFESLMLEFEYNFCGCLCYKNVNKQWKEYVTLFHEWKLLNKHQKDRLPAPLPADEVQRTQQNDFFFIEELSRLLEYLQEKKSSKTLKSKFSSYQDLIQIAEDLQLLQIVDDAPQLNPQLELNWLRKTKQEQATMVYRLLTNYTRCRPDKISDCTERELREIGSSLKAIAFKGWFYFDDYFHAFIGIIREHAPIQLHQKGKKWRYKIPEYSDKDKAFVYAITFQHLFKAGILAIGMHQGRPCFTVTPFGRMTLGD